MDITVTIVVASLQSVTAVSWIGMMSRMVSQTPNWKPTQQTKERKGDCHCTLLTLTAINRRLFVCQRKREKGLQQQGEENKSIQP